MGQAIEHSRCHLRVAEHRRLFAEIQVGGEPRAPMAGSLGEVFRTFLELGLTSFGGKRSVSHTFPALI